MKTGFGYIKWTAVLSVCAFMLFCSSSRKSGGLGSGKGQHSPANNNGRAKTDPLLENLLKQHPELFSNILKNRDSLRVQIIYTQINRLANNKPVFSNYYFNVNPDQYYYPASTVKLPTALLALQKLNELKIAGLDKSSTMITEGGYSGQNEVYNEPNSIDGKPSVANYVKKILLVSDNDAFNRLYEFAGPAYINEQLHKKGYSSAQIIHRLERFLSEDENRHSNPISFYDPKGKLIYKQPMQFNQQTYPERKEQLGNAFYRGDALVQGPMDFSKKNRLVLEDLHSIVKSILFPNEVPANQRFNISPEDYQFVKKYMSQFPNESGYPSYDTANYWDAYCKFLYWGSEKGPLPKTFRIFNKVGDAYGFLIDAAYVVDFATKTEFLLSASMYCNSDGVLNDSKYDYDSVGFPFMKNLGRVIYEYEKKRKKSFIPDLSTFKMNYEK
ncbi:MAG: serine hydrolase [Chitinophagaceae bacterium]|nr:serine hydrolase [Chitinophagaceae bacterium]